MKKLLRELFFLSKGERIALFSVLLFLVAGIITRSMLMEKEFRPQLMDTKTAEFVAEFRSQTDSITRQSIALCPHYFNPNTVSLTSLKQMHFPEKVASNILRYREAGGTFRKKEALQKIYGMSDSLYALIEPWVLIPEKREEVAPTYTTRQEGVQIVTAEAPEGVEIELESVDLNKADTMDLMSLPGIGKSFARRILKYRSLLGGYSEREQLMEVYGMDSARWEGFVSFVQVDSMSLRRLDLNRASFKELLAHPYISKEMCYALVQYRDFSGEIGDVEELQRNQILDAESYAKLRPYLTVDFNKD